MPTRAVFHGLSLIKRCCTLILPFCLQRPPRFYRPSDHVPPRKTLAHSRLQATHKQRLLLGMNKNSEGGAGLCVDRVVEEDVCFFPSSLPRSQPLRSLFGLDPEAQKRVWGWSRMHDWPEVELASFLSCTTLRSPTTNVADAKTPEQPHQSQRAIWPWQDPQWRESAEYFLDLTHYS